MLPKNYGVTQNAQSIKDLMNNITFLNVAHSTLTNSNILINSILRLRVKFGRKLI